MPFFFPLVLYIQETKNPTKYENLRHIQINNNNIEIRLIFPPSTQIRSLYDNMF